MSRTIHGVSCIGKLMFFVEDMEEQLRLADQPDLANRLKPLGRQVQGMLSEALREYWRDNPERRPARAEEPVTGDAVPQAKPRRPYNISPEAREAKSRKMKAYWERRRAKGGDHE